LLLIGCNNETKKNDSENQEVPKEINEIPDAYSLLEAVDYDLQSYGWNYYADMVNYEARSEGTRLGYKRETPDTWKHYSGRLSSHVKAIKVDIEINESDRLPYKGIVVLNDWQEYDDPKLNRGMKIHKTQLNYFWGNKTKKWIRKENVVQ